MSEGSDILLGDVTAAPFAPEAIRLIGSGDIAEEGVDFTGGFGTRFEQKHVAFGDEPVAEIDAAEGNGVSGSVDDLNALAMEKAGLGSG